VAVLHSLLATWVSYVDVERRASDFSTEVYGIPAGDDPGPVISSVCFICSAALGAFSPSVPDLPAAALVAFTPPAPEASRTLVSIPLKLTKLARAPPLT